MIWIVLFTFVTHFISILFVVYTAKNLTNHKSFIESNALVKTQVRKPFANKKVI